MMRVSYFDPATEQLVDNEVATFEDVVGIVEAVGGMSSERGRPTVEITRRDGSTLGISSDDEWVFLVWTDSIGDLYHSMGTSGSCRELVFDYFGSWSEAPAECLVTHNDAKDSIRSFVESGSPVTEAVLFEPD